MLYPVINLDPVPPSPEEGRYTLPSGTLGVLAITVPTAGVIQLVMHQLIADTTNLPQDHSIRAWVSTQKGGNPVIENPVSAAQWTLSALQNRVITVYNLMGNYVPDDEHVSIGIPPGDYWLNVLNLVNEANSFAVEVKGA